MLVDVEVLDVTEDEARKLLLTIDPLAGLAETQEQIHQRLQEITPVDDEHLRALCQAQADKLLAPDPPPDVTEPAEQFLVLVTCKDEREQPSSSPSSKPRGATAKPSWRDPTPTPDS
jgi:hypothetical protein